MDDQNITIKDTNNSFDKMWDFINNDKNNFKRSFNTFHLDYANFAGRKIYIAMISVNNTSWMGPVIKPFRNSSKYWECHWERQVCC